ncbi:MAG TPA: hypothetical protein VMZ33_01865 [Candidatus Limnocylindrales bacterium]|nr:hypothetical protein [Candidatus Limnocylindrales bacterium]
MTRRLVPGVVTVVALALGGCGVGVDARVEKYEGGDVGVSACHKTGARITAAGTYPANAESGYDSADEVWKCMVTETSGAVDKCYVVHESKVDTIVRGVKCSDA